MIWIIHFTVVSLLLLITLKIKNDSFFIKSSFIYSLLIFGQRWMTGTDFPYYLRYVLIDFKVNEPIYDTLQQFITDYNLYFGLLIFTILFITLLNNYRFIIKVDRNVIFILYFYLLSEIFFAQMSQLRQFVAVSFFLNSFYYSHQKKYLASFVNIILGLGFHTSIIFMIPFLFIRLHLNRIKILYFLSVSAILPLLDISMILHLPVFSRYSHYLNSMHNTNLSIFHYMKFYILLIILFVFAWYIKEYSTDRIEQMILNGLILNMLLYGLSFQFGLMIRFSFYLKIFEIIFIVYNYKNLHQFSLKIIKPLILMFFLAIYTGVGLTDPYNITRYEFRILRLYETKTEDQLYHEINTFED